MTHLITMIMLLQPALGEQMASRIATKVDRHCLYPKVAISIYYTESSLKYWLTSNTGDYGLGQINYNVWKKELNIKHPNQLLDLDTNIRLSCQIMNMMYKYRTDEKYWWSYYHSRTPRLRKKYIERVTRTLRRFK